MNYSEIPDLIEVTRIVNTPSAVSIAYSVQGSPRYVVVLKNNSDPYWKMMEGQHSQYRAMMVAIAEEQKIFKASQENMERINSLMLKSTGTAFFSPLHN